MAKTYFCSYCGMQLVWTRKSLTNKAVVVDLIAPHECDERHVKNITDSEEPTAGALLTEGTDIPVDGERRSFPDTGKDMRSGKDIKSTAPHGVLDQVKRGPSEG